MTIKFNLSGGINNTSTDNSLGGDSSNSPILNNKLFDDIPKSETKGFTDYRCLYVFNDGGDILENASFSLQSKEDSEIIVQIGIFERNERQSITISNYTDITGGEISFVYSDSLYDYEFSVQWDADNAVWTDNLQTELNQIHELEDVVVTYSEADNEIIFYIDFLGSSGKRKYDLLVLASNDLISSSSNSISISRDVEGSPINSKTVETDTIKSIPNGIVFYESYELGKILPGDKIPVWIKRIVPPNPEGYEDDGFTFKIIAD